MGSWMDASAALRHPCTKYLLCLAVRQNALLVLTPLLFIQRVWFAFHALLFFH